MHPIGKLGVALLIGVPLFAWASYFSGIPVPESFYAVMLLSLPLFLWPITPRWWCRSCGHCWAQPAPVDDDDDDDEIDEAESPNDA